MIMGAFSITIEKTGGFTMFKIKKTQASNKTVRMPDDLIERLEKLALRNDISFNQLVVQCCEYALENLEPEEKGQ